MSSVTPSQVRPSNPPDVAARGGEVLDPAVVRAWAQQGLDALGRAREEIDALNVFPVPDGDTGTNLYLTFEAAADAVEALPADADVTTTVRALARGALLGARGNSGVILSQLLRGMADVVASPAGPSGDADDAVTAAALSRAADLAYAAVDRPVEGTVLTVARAAATGAATAVGAGLPAVVRSASQAAHDALARTPDQLPTLKRAGVVDAGGRGYVVLVDALVEAVTGRRPPEAASRVPRPAVDLDGVLSHYGGPAYEVMFLLDADDALLPGLRSTLSGLGDSLVVVGGDGLWNVHVHVDDAGAAIEAALAAGRPYRIRITHLQQAEQLRVSGRGELAQRALVVVTHGPGIAALLEEDGATTVPGAPRRRPSTAELLDGVHRATAREVVLLPSDKDTLPVAEAAAAEARDEGLRVAVIPTRSVVQSLAAAAVHDPGRRFDDDVVAMTRAAGATRYGAVTVAAREGFTSAGACRVGDVLGLVDGDIVEIGSDTAAVCARVLDRMLSGGGELVTLVRGLEADDALVESVLRHVRRQHPGTEEIVYDGGQPLWPLIVGVE